MVICSPMPLLGHPKAPRREGGAAAFPEKNGDLHGADRQR